MQRVPYLKYSRLPVVPSLGQLLGVALGDLHASLLHLTKAENSDLEEKTGLFKRSCFNLEFVSL